MRRVCQQAFLLTLLSCLFIVLFQPYMFAHVAEVDKNSNVFNQNYSSKNMSVVNLASAYIEFFDDKEAYSYEKYNDSWQSLRSFHLMKSMDIPLKVYIESNSDRTRLYKDQYKIYVEDSLAMWSDALGGRLKYTLTDFEGDAKIKIYWVEGFQEKYQAGETDCSIEKATIWIKTTELPDNQIKANIMHELGHALGILGHSDNREDIMQGERDWSSYKEFIDYKPYLSHRDVQAVNHLYSRQWIPGEDLYKAVSKLELAKTSLIIHP